MRFFFMLNIFVFLVFLVFQTPSYSMRTRGSSQP